MQFLNHCVFLCLLFASTFCVHAQSYIAVQPMVKVFDISDVSKADVLLRLKSKQGKRLYTLRCHSAGYMGDPEFEYSGDFECRLSLADHQNRYSTLLTEDFNQSRDWESRGRFFSADLRDSCAQIPEFGKVRTFTLRGMRLTLQIIDPVFRKDKLISLKLAVIVATDSKAKRIIADIVPLPVAPVATSCKLSEYFVDSAKIAKNQ